MAKRDNLVGVGDFVRQISEPIFEFEVMRVDDSKKAGHKVILTVSSTDDGEESEFYPEEVEKCHEYQRRLVAVGKKGGK